MITDEIEAMCKTLSEMVPQQLDRGDAFILIASGGKGEAFIQCNYGELGDLGTSFIVGILRYVKACPEPLQSAVVHGLADTLLQQWEAEHGGK